MSEEMTLLELKLRLKEWEIGDELTRIMTTVELFMGDRKVNGEHEARWCRGS